MLIKQVGELQIRLAQVRRFRNGAVQPERGLVLAMPQAVWRDERCASMRYIARCLRRLEREDEAALWLHRAIAETPHQSFC